MRDDENTWGPILNVPMSTRRQALEAALTIATCNPGGETAERVVENAKAIEAYLTAGEVK